MFGRWVTHWFIGAPIVWSKQVIGGYPASTWNNLYVVTN